MTSADYKSIQSNRTRVDCAFNSYTGHAKSSQLGFDQRGYFVPMLLQTLSTADQPIVVTWDRCARLTRGVVHQFLRRKWPASAFTLCCLKRHTFTAQTHHAYRISTSCRFSIPNILLPPPARSTDRGHRESSSSSGYR